MVGIYKITSPNNKVYIGQSWDIKRREGVYRREQCKKQNHIYNSIKEYGWEAHRFEHIHELPSDVSQETLNLYEVIYWELYIYAGTTMLNIKEPGVNGKHSQETKFKIGKSSAGSNNYFYGRVGTSHPMYGKERPSKKGLLNGRSKLSEQDVLNIRVKYNSGVLDQHELSSLYKVSQPVIAKIVKGESWSHVGGPLTFKGKGNNNKKLKVIWK